MTAIPHSNVYGGALLDEVIREQKLSRELVKKAAREILVIIEEGLLRDGVVRINNFGSFRLKRVAARKGRNPQTGEVINIPERNRVMFTPCKALRDMIEPAHAAAVAAEPVQVQKPETETVSPQTIPEPVRIKAESQSVPVIDQHLVHQAEHEEAVRQVFKNSKNSGQNRLVYAGIAAGIIALVLAGSLIQAPETSVSSAAIPEPGKKFAADSVPVSVEAVQQKELVSEVLVSEQKVEPALTQMADPQTGLPQGEPEMLAVNESGTSLSLDKNTATDMPQSASEVIAVQDVELPAEMIVTEPASFEQAQPVTEQFFKQRPYRLVAGNSLWRLSKRFYNEPLYWPHIFYANSDTISDPDRLPQGRLISMPALEGQAGNLTDHDRQNIAEGYFLVYHFYRESGHPDAFFALLEAKRYSSEVVQRNRHELKLSAVERILLEQQQESLGL